MFEFLKQFMTQVQANFKVLPPAKKIAVASIASATLMGIALLIIWTNRIDYQPLYFNLSMEDAGMVVEELKDQKIPFRLSANGKTVMVPSDRVYDLRLDMASRGIPSGGGIGFEIFDRTDLGTTEFVQKLNYQRALQGELARTINQFAEVEQSRVHITLPEKTIFLEDEQQPTASVVLKLRRRDALKEKHVQGIVHLVAGSVEGLNPENITVVDVDGNVLSAGASDDSKLVGLTGNQQEFQREIEEGLEKRVQTMLEKVVGAGKAIVRVSATLDFKQEEKTEEIFDPESAVIRSEQRTDERSKGITPVAMGVPGVASNLPEGGGESASKVSSSDVRNTNETVNYEINKVVKRIVKPIGVIKSLSVAVLIDGTYDVVKGEDGKEEYSYVPRSDEDMKKYKNIVMTAVGYNEERGDQIEVTTTPFERVQLSEAEKKEMARDTLWWKIWGWVPYMATILLVALLVVVVLRPLVKWITRPQEGRFASLTEGGSAGELVERSPKFLREGVPGREQVARLAKADAERFAKGLRQWMS